VDQYHEDFIQPYQLVCLDNATLYMITVKPLGIKVLDISYPPEAILIKEIQLLEVPKYSDAKLFLDDWVVILAPTIPAPSKLFLINASSPRNPSVAQQIDLPRSDSFGDMGKLFIDDEDSLVIIRTGWNYLLGYRLKGDKLQRVWEYPIGYNFYYHGCLAAKRTFYAFYSDDSLRVHMYVLSTDTPQDAGSKALANREYDVPSSHHVVRDNRLFMTYQACHDVHNLTWCDWAFIILDISDPLDPFVILDQRGGSYWYQCCPDIAVSDSLFYLFGCPHSVTVSRNFAKPNSLDVVGYIDDLKFGNYSITPETQPAFFLSHPDYGLYSVHRTWIPLPSPPSDTVGFISAPTVSRDRFNLVVNMPYDAWARVKAYNMAGQAVAVIHEGMISSGPNYLSWEPGPIGAGVYVVTVEVEHRIVARARVVYLK